MLGDLPEVLFSFPQRCLDFIAFRDINRHPSNQRQVPFFVDDRKLAHQALMYSILVGSGLDCHHRLGGGSHLCIVGLELSGSVIWQKFIISLLSPLLQTDAEGPGKGIIEIQIPAL